MRATVSTASTSKHGSGRISIERTSWGSSTACCSCPSGRRPAPDSFRGHSLRPCLPRAFGESCSTTQHPPACGTRFGMPRRFLALLAVALVMWGGCGSTGSPTGSTGSPPPPDPSYAQSIESWRAERDQRLRSEDGWLTLVGLHWLEPGDNPFGSAPGLPVTLPEG